MRTERNHAIAHLEVADDRSRFVAKAGNLHGTPRDSRRFPFNQPYARTLAGIADRANRHLQRRVALPLRDLDGDSRTERRVAERTRERVPSLEGSSLTVCRVGQLAKLRRSGQRSSVQGCTARGSDRRTQRFGKVDDGLARPRVRNSHDYLPGSDDLPRLRQRFDYNAVRVSRQECIAGVVAGDIGLRLGRIEVRSSRFGGSLDLLIRRCRNRAGADELAVSRFFQRGLARASLRRGNSLLLCL